jgi:hypothetical protein
MQRDYLQVRSSKIGVKTYLRVPKVSAEMIALGAKLEGDDFVHCAGKGWADVQQLASGQQQLDCGGEMYRIESGRLVRRRACKWGLR